MTLRVAIYTRISDDREGRALGVERQEADCRALVRRLGYDLIEIYDDNDISASTLTRKIRPSYRRMLTDAAAGAFDVVVAATSSRLTRRPRELDDLIELAERHGTRLEYVSSPSFDLNTADGRMMARILAAADAAEAERIGERTRRKLTERTAAGLPHGGQRPYGWEPDRMTIRESEAEHLRTAVEQVLGGLPIRSAVRSLNAAGSTNTRGGAWTHATLRGVLVKPRHAGLMPDGETAASWPAIITPEQHRALLRLVNDPARVVTPGRGGKLHLLSGQPCGVCGAPIRVGKSSSRSAPSYYTYRCQARWCVVRNKDHIDDFVLRVIAGRLQRDDVATLLAADADEAARVARVAAEAEAERLRNLIDEAADEHARAGLSVRALTAYTAPLRQALTEAEEATTPPKDRAAAFGDILHADDRGGAFLAAGVDRQRAILAVLAVVRIGKGHRGNTFDPHGIEVEWR